MNGAEPSDEAPRRSLRFRYLMVGSLALAAAGLLVGISQPAVGWRWATAFAAVIVAYTAGVYRERAEWVDRAGEVNERIEALWAAVTGRWPTDDR